MKTLNKKELCELLNVKPQTLKDIEKQKKLEEKLNKIGYKLYMKEKRGRYVYYYIELVHVNREIYNNLVKTHYKTSKIDEFTNYFKVRTDSCKNNLPIGKKDIANASNVSVNTISKWDSISINEDIISQDGYYYFKIKVSTREIIQVEYEEYSEYWKDRLENYNISKIKKLYNEGVITLDELLKTVTEYTVAQSLINAFYFRVKKYVLNDKNKLYLTLNALIDSMTIF